jgi:TonB family protein
MKLPAAILLCVAAMAAARGENGHDHSVSAIDARGARYVRRTSDGQIAPWTADVVFSPKPAYPYGERNLRHEGVAVFRLDIDIKTGTTTSATMLQSSGFPKLDDVAFDCVRRWRWRPGTWKQVEVPVMFTITGRHLNGW